MPEPTDKSLRNVATEATTLPDDESLFDQGPRISSLKITQILQGPDASSPDLADGVYSFTNVAVMVDALTSPNPTSTGMSDDIAFDFLETGNQDEPSALVLDAVEYLSTRLTIASVSGKLLEMVFSGNNNAALALQGGLEPAVLDALKQALRDGVPNSLKLHMTEDDKTPQREPHKLNYALLACHRGSQDPEIIDLLGRVLRNEKLDEDVRAGAMVGLRDSYSPDIRFTLVRILLMARDLTDFANQASLHLRGYLASDPDLQVKLTKIISVDRFHASWLVSGEVYSSQSGSFFINTFNFCKRLLYAGKLIYDRYRLPTIQLLVRLAVAQPKSSS